MAQQYGNSSNITVKMGGPYGNAGGSSAKITEIEIPAAAWKGASSTFSQEVIVDVISVNSRVDLIPSVEQIMELRENGIALVAGNDAGVVTIYAFGNKPAKDYSIYATVSEVTA